MTYVDHIHIHTATATPAAIIIGCLESSGRLEHQVQIIVLNVRENVVSVLEWLVGGKV